jgi:hypothetical protein
MSAIHLTEIFRLVTSNPAYRVSNVGQVQCCLKLVGPPDYSHMTDSWHDLLPHRNAETGYLEVCIRSHGKGKTTAVHKLVAEAFLGPCPEGLQVCHDDNDKTNPRLDNLCYGTPKQNNADKKRHGTQQEGSRVAGAKLVESDVIEIMQMRAGWLFRQIAEKYGVQEGTIGKIFRGETWSHLTSIPSRIRKG